MGLVALIFAAAAWIETSAASPVPSCRFDGPPLVKRLDDVSLLYCGRINADGVETFRGMAQPMDRRLHIASSGGELDAPLDLAELVLKGGLDVVVEGPCLSGCAAFVFVAGGRRSVAAAGLLALHNTSSSAELLSVRLQPSTSTPTSPLSQRAARERRLYYARGVAPRLLVEPQVRVKTVCASDGGRDPRTGEGVINFHTLFDLWAPSANQWRGAGVPFDGPLPAGEAEIKRRLLIFAPDGQYAAVRFVMGGDRLDATPERYLYDVGACPAEAWSSQSGPAVSTK